MERTLRATFASLTSLEEVNEDDRLSLQSAFDTLLSARSRAKDPLGCSSVELLVLAGEAAVSLGEFGLAATAADAFFTQGAPEDQFFVRALFIRALVVADAAAPLNGSAAVAQLGLAISHIIRAVEIAAAPGRVLRYGFLVYNASVHFYNIARPMMRDGARKYYVSQLQRIVDVLEEVNERDLHWRSQLLVPLALGYDEMGEAESAVNCANLAAEFARNDVEIQRLQIHLGRKAPTTVRQTAAEAKERGELALTLQLLRSGIVQDAEEMRSELESVLLIADPPEYEPSEENDQSENENSGGELEEDGGPAAKIVELGVVVEIGRIALKFGLPDITERCIDSASRAKRATPQADIALDYMRAELLATHLGARAIPSCKAATTNEGGEIAARRKRQKAQDLAMAMDARRVEALRLARRVEGVKILERAILSCKLLGDASLLEDGCVLAWNLGLPLLQPHLRKHVHRMFLTAAAALEEVDSPMKRLRAHLHAEVAKCEVAADFLAKATMHVAKALALDYGSADSLNGDKVGDTENDPDATIAREEKLRSLDKFLRPLFAKLELKTSVYMEPESVEEQALMQIEQAKDAREPHLKASLLARAATLLERGTIIDDDGEGGVEAAAETEAEAATEAAAAGGPLPQNQGTQLALWGELTKLAWKAGKLELAQRAARHVLECPFTLDRQRHKELFILQAEVHFVYAETQIEQIRTAYVHPDAPLSGGLNARSLGTKLPTVEYIDDFPEGEEPEDCWDLEEEPFDAKALLELKCGIISSFLEGMRLGQTLDEGWITENAVVYLWNYHLHIFTGSAVEPGGGDSSRFVVMLPELLEALKEGHSALDAITTKDPKMFCSLSLVLARGLELRGESGDLEYGMQVCRRGIQCGSVMMTKDLQAALARLARENGSKEPLPEENRAKVFAMLELLGLPAEVVSETEKRDLLSQSVEALSIDSDESGVGDADRENNEMKQGQIPSDPMENPEATAHAVAEAKDRAQGHAESWARLGRASLDLGDLAIAQACVRRAVAPPLPTASEVGDMAAAVAAAAASNERCWRWFSVAECLWGQIVTAQIVPEKQEKATQDELRQQSLEHFCSAAEWGNKAKLPALVLAAARQLWNSAIPFTVSAVTRKMLFAPLRRMLVELAKLGLASLADGPFRVQLYCQLFACYTDIEDWSGGLSAVEEAFRHVPQNLHKALWESRVVFSSKLGKDVAAGLHKLKEGDASLQARAWVTLARSSSNVGDQVRAYISAIEALSDSFERVDYLIEFGEWLYVNNLPRQDAADALMAAADLLLEVEREPAHDDEDEPDPSDGAQSRAGRSQSSRRTNRTNQTQRSGQARSKTGGDRVTRASSVTASRRGGTKRAGSVASSRGGRSSVVHGSRRGSIAPSSASDVGGAGNEIANGFPDHLETKHLLSLSRIYVMLARIAPNQDRRVDFALLAHDSVLRIWELSVRTANIAEAVTFRADLDQEDERRNLNMVDFVKTLPASILHCLPSTSHDWVEYVPSDALRDRMKMGGLTAETEGCTVCVTSVQTPALTLHYLLELVEFLVTLGFDIHALPVLSLINLIANDVLPKPSVPWRNFVGMRNARLLDTINCSKKSRSIVDVLGPQGLTENDIKAHGDEVMQLEQQQQRQADASAAGVVDKNSAGSMEKTLKENEEEDEEFVVDVSVCTPALKRKRIAEPVVREIWVLHAWELVSLGEYAAAKSILYEVDRHNKAFEDRENEAAASLVYAKIRVLEGEAAVALKDVLRTVRILAAVKGNVLEWLRSVQALVETLQLLGRRREAKSAMAGAVAAFAALVTSDSTEGEDMDAVIASAILEADLAEEIMREALLSYDRGSPTWCEEWAKSQAHFEHASVELRRFGLHPVLAQSLLRQGRASLSVYKRTGRQRESISLLISAGASCRAAKTHAEQLLARSSPPGKPREIVLPVERLLGEVLCAAGDIALCLAEWSESSEVGDQCDLRVVANSARGYGSQRGVELTVAEQWLRDTAPPKERTEEDKLVTEPAKALLLFSSAAHLIQPIAPLRASVKLRVGRGLRRAAELASQSEAIEIWTSHTQQESENVPANCSEDASEMNSDNNDETKDNSALSSTDASPSKQLSESRTQAIAILEEAVNVARSEKRFETLASAAMELVEAIGFSNARKASEYLVLYQSCCSRSWLLSIFSRCCPPTSKQGLFMRHSNHLEAQRVCPWSTTQGEEVTTFLESSSIAWSRMDCSSSVSDLVDALPNFSTCLTLTLDPDERILYAAAISREGGEVGSVRQVHALARHVFSPEERSAMSQLVDSCATFQKQVATFLLRYQDEHGEDGDFLSISSSIEDEDRLERDMESIVERLEALLASVLQQPLVADFLKARKDEASVSHLVLVASNTLARLPLESLSALSGFTSISRDFSLHLYNRRLSAIMEGGSTASGLSYVVDPRYEDKEEEEVKSLATHTCASGVVHELKNMVGSGAKWNGLEGKDGIPGCGEWQRLLTGCNKGTMMYYGLGRILSHIEPSRLANLNLSGCWAALLFDRTANDGSYRRQSKIDNQSSEELRELQRPLECAALFSLLGVNSLLLNQWSNSFCANERLAKKLLKSLKDGKALAEAITSTRMVPTSNATSSNGDESAVNEVEADDVAKPTLKARVRWNTVVWGCDLPIQL